MRLIHTAMVMAGALLLAPARAEFKAEYGASAPWVRQWYETRTLNEETMQRLGVQWRSCCAHSDVVKTRFKVDRHSGGDVWFWWDDGRSDWRRIPDDVVHPNEHAPDGSPTLFAYQGIETCFFPGEGGL